MGLTASVPDDVAEHTRHLATVTERSVSAVVAEALRIYLATERRRLAADRVAALIGRAAVAPDADDLLREMRRASD